MSDADDKWWTGKEYIIRGRSTQGASTMADAIEYLRRVLKRDPEARGYLLPSYVTAICVGIEAEINDELIQHFASQVPYDYRRYARPFLFMPVQERARTTIVLTTNYRYQLDEDAPSVKDMFDLFSFRNKLVHIQHHVQDRIVAFDEEGNIASSRFVPSPDSDYWALRLEGGPPLTKTHIDAWYKLYRRFRGVFGSLGWRIENGDESEEFDCLKKLNPGGRRQPLRPIFMYRTHESDAEHD